MTRTLTATAFAIALLGASTAWAQTSGSTGGSAGGATATQGTAQGGASRTNALDRGDRKFVEEAAAGGMAEVAHGRAAAQKATNPQVKAFAERMVADHTRSNEELKTIATARGITLPAEPPKKAHKEMDKLMKKDGADFDKAYMKHMVDDHKKTVNLFEKQAKNGKDGDLKSFAAKTLPTLQEHLKLAQATHDAVKDAK
jgi:putative membrane protein